MALVLVLVLCWSVSTSRTAIGQEEMSSLGEARRAEIPHSKDHVLVKLRSGASAAQVVGASADRVFDHWHRVPLPSGRSPIEMVQALAKRPGIEVAELDYTIQVEPSPAPASLGEAQAEATDPYASYQWHFPPIQVPESWEETTGEGVVVAIVDSGISKGGVDLDCHTFVHPFNAITGVASPGAAVDDNGHGTHIAGTVAQCTNNGVGVAGIAFDAALMPVKVLEADGSGEMSAIAQGIDWAIEHGADVINLSLGCELAGCSSSIIDEAIAAAVAAGVVVVAASGNSDLDYVAYPANHPDVIGVGAVDLNLRRAHYSNRGTALDLVAPGGDVKQDANSDGYVDGVLQETFEGSTFGYYFWNGTSMAAPHVSGAAALLRSFIPDAGAGAIRQALIGSADDLGPAGFDTAYGHGLIQIRDAIDELTTLDWMAPTWPESAELSVKTYGETELTLQWDGAVDNTSVTGYWVRTSETSGFTTTEKSAVITGLEPGHSHIFEVLARDETGNWSDPLTALLRTSLAFVDTPGHLFYNDILWMSGEDITRGCNPPVNDLFCPDNAVTRETMAAFLVRALGLTENDHSGFEDVVPGSTFANDIGKLATAGITKGCNPPVNDRFCPKDAVTRETMAAFLVRALELTENTHPGFRDVSSGNIFAHDIGKLATAGITKGCNPPANDLFCPGDVVTRGQLAAFLHRALR
jgi:subtilisin family serine protease